MNPHIETNHSAPADLVNAEMREILLLTLKPSSKPHQRRHTDITPASRKYCNALFPPMSPKMHELLEKSETNELTGNRIRRHLPLA